MERTTFSGLQKLGRAALTLAALAILALGQDANPLEEFLPADALTLAGVSADSFANRDEPLRFGLKGADFDVTDPGGVQLRINGAAVSREGLRLTSNEIAAANVLADGKNEIAFKAYDTVGRPLYYNATLWAGTALVRVELIRPDGSPFTEPAVVTVTLGDNASARALGTTRTGTLEVRNVPAGRLSIEAASGGKRTVVGVTETPPLVRLVL